VDQAAATARERVLAEEHQLHPAVEARAAPDQHLRGRDAGTPLLARGIAHERGTRRCWGEAWRGREHGERTAPVPPSASIDNDNLATAR
jgi:hypothetical protein